MEPHPQETPAEQRAKAKLGLINHVGVYLIVMITLAMVNLATNRHVLWFLWPAVGWGIAILLHAFSVLMMSPSTRLYSRLLEREKRRGA